MIYLLCSIAAVMSVIVAFTLNSMSPKTKHRNVKKALLILFSILIYITLVTYLLKQNSYD